MPKHRGTDVLPDHYAVLQVHPKAAPEVIDAAWKALLKRHHPDAGTSGVHARALNAAHDVLSDTRQRATYDRERMPAHGDMVGQYEVLEQIAEGGFGSTHKCRDTITGLLSCVKFCTNVPPEYYDLLVEEARIISDLRHYAIPAYRQLARRDDGSYALVMSYIEGPTLEKVVRKAGRMDAEDVAWIAERVLNALKYLHYQGVIHGDIKPQNIIVQPERHMAVLVDFGLSAVRPTATTEAKGFTELFAPPEQVEGKPILPESDFYSLGITMLYALSGGDEDAVKRRLVPAQVPDALAAFIKQLIVRDVLRRPRWPEDPTKSDLIDQLRAVRKEAFGNERSQMKPIRGL